MDPDRWITKKKKTRMYHNTVNLSHRDGGNRRKTRESEAGLDRWDYDEERERERESTCQPDSTKEAMDGSMRDRWEEM